MADTQRFLKRMIVSTINAREVESNRVSRLLHDEVGQVLTAVGLQLDVMKLDYRAQVPEITGRINEIQQLLDQAVQQVRALSYDLNPAIVERAGLQIALDRLVGRFRGDFNGSLRFLYDSAVRVPLDVANSWYKIAELALENAVQHAGAGKIEVHVRATAKARMLEVRDDGRGFSPGDSDLRNAGLGLLLMEHYASQAPISLSIRSTPGKGTTVRCTHAPGQRRKVSGSTAGAEGPAEL